jgi:hypothetical protein
MGKSRFEFSLGFCGGFINIRFKTNDAGVIIIVMGHDAV